MLDHQIESVGPGLFTELRVKCDISPDERLQRSADVSQVPVVDQNGKVVGLLDESDVLVKVHQDPERFNHAVHAAMTDKLETLAPTAKMNDLLEVFDRGRVAIIMDGDKFLGLITRSDLLSYLRRQMPS